MSLNGNIWTYSGGGSLTPREVATIFAAEYFDDAPRRVSEVVGNCFPGGWEGTFRLKDGRHVYRLRFSDEGPWSVSVVQEGNTNG